MSEKSPYSDKRTDFFREFFQQGLPYDDYVATGEAKHAQRWNDMANRISLSAPQQTQVESFVRTMNVLVMSGTWCGDCVRQGPMLRAIEEASNVMHFRYLDNRENPDLQDELKINGAQKVPVVVVFSEDFFELDRFGDRHLSVYRRKAETELGAACDAGIVPPSDEELSLELQEWIDHFERLQLILRLAPMLRKRYGD